MVQYDIVLKNAKIIPGNMEPSIQGDVCIKDGRIEKICDSMSGMQDNSIDCKGLYLAPGFIDSHSHDDLGYGNDFVELGKISQGITTVITGQCGVSMAPVRPQTVELLWKQMAVINGNDLEEMKAFDGYSNYLKIMGSKKSRLNHKFLVGHGTIRTAAMGVEDREPTCEEMENMKEMVKEAMLNGATGMSSGLIYPPGVYSKREEIIELLKVVSEYGGVYATHMRNESDEILDALEEALECARKADVPIIISHHKIAGKKNHGLSHKTLEIIDQGIQDGMRITLDQYPYNSGSTNMYMLIPPHLYRGGMTAMIDKIKDPSVQTEIIEEIMNPTYKWDNFYQNCGGFENILIAFAPQTPQAQGKSIKDYAEGLGQDGFKTFFDLLIQNNGNVVGVFIAMNDEDVERIIKHPHTVIGTDGVAFSKDILSHPRGFGSFPKVIKKFVREEGILSLTEAIHKMTSLTAQRNNILNKGRVEEGYDADLVLFDFDRIQDNATYENPFEVSDGIELVIVNGEIVYEEKQLLPNYSGKIVL